jgi:hypothetical protein
MRINVFFFGTIIVKSTGPLPREFVYIYIYNLLSDAVSSLNNMALDGRMINEWWTAKDERESGRNVVEGNNQIFALMAWEGPEY